MNAIVPHGHDFRQSTDAAGLCGTIVKQTARNIQGRRYVSVEGWQAIAIAHGCTASALDVQRVNDEGLSGFKCVGVVRRMEDGAEIARAEGFLGDDENTWNKRPVYARRAMVQTRAISRACRSAFAHVVVMIDAGLSTTPAEEVPDGGFIEGQFQEASRTGEPHEPATSTLREQLEQSVAEDQSTNERAARGRNNGPTKTKLDSAENRIVHELNGCGDEDSLIAYLETEDYKTDKALLEEYRPSSLYGPAPEDCPEYVPIKARIARLVADFRNPAREPTPLDAG